MAEEQLNTTWWVYILECGDGTLYTGIAKDLAQRVTTHNRALGARYTRARLPVKLLYHELALDHSTALKRELAIKKMPRRSKLALIQTKLTAQPTNPS